MSQCSQSSQSSTSSSHLEDQLDDRIQGAHLVLGSESRPASPPEATTTFGSSPLSAVESPRTAPCADPLDPKKLFDAANGAPSSGRRPAEPAVSAGRGGENDVPRGARELKGSREEAALDFDTLGVQVEQLVTEIDAGLEELASTLRHVVAHVSKAARKAFAGRTVQVMVFGSRKCQLALPDSDIDLGFVVDKQFRCDWPTMMAHVHCLADALFRSGQCSNLQVIPAAMPLIKFVTPNGIPVDVTHLGVDHHGPRAANLVNTEHSQHPTLRPVVLVLKQLLRQEGLNDPFNGSLSSYALYLLVAAFLEHRPHQKHGAQETKGEQKRHPEWLRTQVAKDLVHFLQFHSMLDFRTVRICLKRGYLPRGGAARCVDVMISNPCVRNTNVAPNAFRISQIKALWKKTLASLTLAEDIRDLVAIQTAQSYPHDSTHSVDDCSSCSDSSARMSHRESDVSHNRVGSEGASSDALGAP